MGKKKPFLALTEPVHSVRGENPQNLTEVLMLILYEKSTLWGFVKSLGLLCHLS